MLLKRLTIWNRKCSPKPFLLPDYQSLQQPFKKKCQINIRHTWYCSFSHLTNFLSFFKGCWRDWQSRTGTGNALRGHSNCVCLHVVLVARNRAHFFGDGGSYEFAHYKTLYPRHAWRFQKENWPDNQRQTRKFTLFFNCLEMKGNPIFQFWREIWISFELISYFTAISSNEFKIKVILSRFAKSSVSTISFWTYPIQE